MSDRQLDLFNWSPTVQIGALKTEESDHAGDFKHGVAVAPEGAPTVLSFRQASTNCGNLTSPWARVAIFPLDRRHTKVQDVATKLLAKTTERAVEHYRSQVTEAMLGHLASRHISTDQHREQVRRFWVAVDCEVARRVNGRQRPTGGAE